MTETRGGWWALEFPECYFIQTVTIYNRDKQAMNRINETTIRLDDQMVAEIEYVEGKNPYNLTEICLFGKVVNITAYKNKNVQLAEVEVYGKSFNHEDCPGKSLQVQVE